MLYLESQLEVMDQADLLQWISAARMTGRCSFSNGHRNRKLFFRDGRIVACDSNEPHLLLGQFLISSGRIAPDALRAAMLVQERTGTTLGTILVESGKITQDELNRLIVAKAEETVVGLAEWRQGFFRFVPGVEPSKDSMRVDLSIQHVLLEGARRVDEMQQALDALKSSRAVLHRTDRPVDEPTIASFMGRRLYDLIDGQRNIEELVLQGRTSRYAAYTFLARLVERGHLRVEEAAEQPDDPGQRDRPDLILPELQHLVSNEHWEASIDLIEDKGFARSHDDILSMLVAKAEAGYIASAYRSKLPPDGVPHRMSEDSSDVVLQDDLTADETFLLELVDGNWDVRSLVWISPLRKIEVIRGLSRLLDLGYVHIQPPKTKAASRSGDEGPAVDEAVDDIFREPQPA